MNKVNNTKQIFIFNWVLKNQLAVGTSPEKKQDFELLKKNIYQLEYSLKFDFDISRPRIAVLGLNPHCETVDKFSEEDKIIKPAIKILKKKNIYVSGPFPADTFFLKKNTSGESA